MKSKKKKRRKSGRQTRALKTNNGDRFTQKEVEKTERGQRSNRQENKGASEQVVISSYMFTLLRTGRGRGKRSEIYGLLQENKKACFCVDDCAGRAKRHKETPRAAGEKNKRTVTSPNNSYHHESPQRATREVWKL